MLWHEVGIARGRIHQEFVTQAVLLNSAVAALLDKDAAKEFKKLCKKLSADG